MKSKRAKEYSEQFEESRPTIRDINMVVNFAEQDARDRAIEAYCAVCSVNECPGYKNGEMCLDGQGSLGSFIREFDK